MKYKIGLDIGIGSVGWSVIKLDEETESPIKIEDLGVRKFDVAENPKNGESLAKTRRDARSIRRTLRRRRHRLTRIKNLLITAKLISNNDFHKLYSLDPWQLRAEALDRKLTNIELARIILHISKHRGFKSNRKAEIKDDNLGVTLKSINENNELMNIRNYRTIGEMFYKDERFANKKRNEPNNYSHTVSRLSLENELKTIFESQRNFKNHIITKELESKILGLFNSQRHYATEEQVLKMIGSCTFEKNEKRSPKSAYTYERFMLFNKINTIVIRENGKYRFLTQLERNQIDILAYSKEKISYSNIRKELKLNTDARFKGLVYGKKSVSVVEKKEYISLKFYHELKKALIENNIKIEELDIDTLDHIGYALTIYKEDTFIKRYLEDNNIVDEIINACLGMNFKNVGHLSLKAIKKILPYMEQGQSYTEAFMNAGYSNIINIEKQKLLPVRDAEGNDILQEINNPVVVRALSQTRKVINSIIRKYGSPISVHVELARDMSHTYKERKKIESEMDKNRLRNEAAVKSIKELQKLPHYTGMDIVKMKLWIEQNGICPYSITENNNYIDVSRLLEIGYIEVDHIIPYSKSFDDSYNNKVLVFTDKNQEKGNKTPYEFFGNNSGKWEAYERWVKNNVKSQTKISNLLKMHYTETDEREFKSRNLNDTRYISTYIKNYIEQYLLFAPSAKMKKRVYAVNGSITSFVRKRWGLTKEREINDRHHALDATVVALTSPGMIQKITAFIKFNEISRSNKMVYTEEFVDTYTGEIFSLNEFPESLNNKFPLPWVHFRNELLIRLNSDNPAKELKLRKFNTYKTKEDFENVKPLLVSRMPNAGVFGQAHKQTLKRLRTNDNSKHIAVEKVPLSEIELDEYKEWNMYDKESDVNTYNAVKERLLQYNNDSEKAFKEPLYKPKKDGTPGIIIKSVKVVKTCNTGVYFDDIKAVADNGGICRIDVFRKNGKYYIVPLYNSDIAKKGIPDLIIKAGCPNRLEWERVDDSYEFMFSLFKNDMVRIIKGNKEIWGYYKRCPGNVPSIYIDTHDNSGKNPTQYGITTLKSFEKYYVDVLGNKYLMNGEVRRDLEKFKNNKTI